MKAILSAIVVGTGICCASAAFAVEPASAASGSSTTTSSPRSTGDAWRYKFYRDHWWYWLPTNRWAVDDNGRWLLPPEQDLAGATSASSGKTTGAADGKQFGGTMEDESTIAVGAERAKHSAEYYLSAGGVFSRHAHDHAQVLERYAASGDTVPANIVRHQAEAIHHDVEHARKSFSRALSANAETNGETRNAIKELQTGLRKVTESVRRLESLVHEQGTVQATLVKDETAIVSRLLQETNRAASAAEDEARQRAEEEDRADID